MAREAGGKVTTCDVCRGACCEALVQTVREESSSHDYFDFIRTRATARLPGHRLLFLSRCPELTQDGRCGIQHAKPRACSDFPMGGRECLEVIELLRPQLLEG